MALLLATIMVQSSHREEHAPWACEPVDGTIAATRHLVGECCVEPVPQFRALAAYDDHDYDHDADGDGEFGEGDDDLVVGMVVIMKMMVELEGGAGGFLRLRCCCWRWQQLEGTYCIELEPEIVFHIIQPEIISVRDTLGSLQAQCVRDP